MNLEFLILQKNNISPNSIHKLYRNRNWKGLKDISVDLDENTKRKRQPQLELKKPIFREYLTSREDKTEKMATLEWSGSPIHIKEEGSIFNKINSNVLRMPSNKTLRGTGNEKDVAQNLMKKINEYKNQILLDKSLEEALLSYFQPKTKLRSFSDNKRRYLDEHIRDFLLKSLTEKILLISGAQGI